MPPPTPIAGASAANAAVTDECTGKASMSPMTSMGRRTARLRTARRSSTWHARAMSRVSTSICNPAQPRKLTLFRSMTTATESPTTARTSSALATGRLVMSTSPAMCTTATSSVPPMAIMLVPTVIRAGGA